ncbi:hypothetical protein Golob_018240 [Gossypium lobatum]|uniref:Uncharacterized protein n=1 Tax=Gossypium lobatum TaxID=34289 RepID=A0A7J8M9M3_9ROSI|nr:hypothetical protein [Gossypium lobatum]
MGRNASISSLLKNGVNLMKRL